MESKARFVIVLSLLLVTGFLGISFISYFVAHDSLSEQLSEVTLPLTSDNIYSEIQRDLLRPIFIASLMASDTFVRDWVLSGEKDVSAIKRYLEEYQTRYGTETSFFVSDKSGNYYHPSGILKKVGKSDPLDQWYFRVKSMREDYEVNVDVDTADPKSITIFINYRAYDYQGNFLGVIGVGLAMESVQRLIETYQNRYGRHVYFIDREGGLALTGAGGREFVNIREREGLKKVATQLLTSPGISTVYQCNGVKMHLNSRLIPEFDWYLIVEQRENHATGKIDATLLSNLAMSGLISLGILFLANLTINRYQRRLEAMATTDKLTGLANRQIFDMLFSQAYKNSKRRKSKLSVILFDIDHFKQVNDSYGHTAGDAVLKTLAQTVKNFIRESDIPFRWGGEEFLILLPECGLRSARHIAEKIRKGLASEVVMVAGNQICVTISAGVGELGKGDSAETFLAKTDKALYQAKENGRNRVEVAKEAWE